MDDKLPAIPPATAEDLRDFEVEVNCYANDFREYDAGEAAAIRVACHFQRRLAEAERLLRAMMDTPCMSVYADARKFLEAKP